MPTKKLTIVPITLDPLPEKISAKILQQQPTGPSCIIKIADAEISLFNGIDEHIIQTIMQELMQK